MRQRRPSYVRISLKEGQGVGGGIFANESFGSLNPQRADVYLEQAWRLDADGNFLQAVPASRGVWIAQDAAGRPFRPLDTGKSGMPAWWSV